MALLAKHIRDPDALFYWKIYSNPSNFFAKENALWTIEYSLSYILEAGHVKDKTRFSQEISEKLE